ncbi:MAG: glycosyltransferase [Verrucomicrobiales bacterium]|nr:glycosyltransferase [Verrucomicrobiales bacterium]
MRCLWLTRKYPRPINSGELIYSDGLIRSFAEAGVELTVIAHDNSDQAVGDGTHFSEYTDEQGVNWRLGTPDLGGRLGSLLTSLPGDAYRLKNGGPEEAFRKALDDETWDAVIIDHAAIGWALHVLREKNLHNGVRPRPRIIYISHNHEAKIRREIASKSRDPLLKKTILKWDAEKYARLENELCAGADLVTAITDTEVDAYRENFPEQNYLCLTPGYHGDVYPDHKITEEIPRRVIMSGSFEWIAKRMNLEIFLEKAALPLALSKIELQIVGKTNPRFCAQISERFPSVNFVGTVPNMSPYLLNARMGLIVEELGGGFKLKQLDYVFHNLPIAGLECAVDGLPLQSPEEILLERNTEDLVHGIVETIDDIDHLNQMRASAFEKCSSAFRWEDRGTRLADAIADLSK